jgi:hypothetical protein
MLLMSMLGPKRENVGKRKLRNEELQNCAPHHYLGDQTEEDEMPYKFLGLAAASCG